MKSALSFIFFILHIYVISQQSILTDSNLPIMVIETDINPNNNSPYEIQDEPKVPATMKLIFRPDSSRNYLSDINTPEYLNYNGKIGIEFRGSTSQLLDKKPYGFTTTLADNTTNNNVSLLGMPEENDWILNSLAFDESMIRDMLSYDVARKLGDYTSKGQYVEVISNGDYKGVYILLEKIKRDSKRVNVLNMSAQDDFLPDLTGGYIVKCDKTTGGDDVAWLMPGPTENAEFIYFLPKPELITAAQANYIENYFYELDTRTNPANSSISNGYPELIDIPSFINFMLIAELSSNVDAYKLSTYFHKDRNGKLRAGPIWDYNLTFGNDLIFWGYDRSRTDVWQFNNSDNNGPYFWLRLFDDPSFNCYFAKRWFELSAAGQPMNYFSLEDDIDFYTELLNESAEREQLRWGSVGGRLDNVDTMKTWLQERIVWINNNIGSPAACNNLVLPKLVISKIHYNPLNQINYSSNQLEYFEITNNSNETIDLTGLYIRELGLSYSFPAGSEVGPNQIITLCSNPEIFTAFYGYVPFGGYTRTLSNKDYNILLCDAFGNIIDEVHYFDSAPWPIEADGTGPFLSLIDLNSDNALAQNWVAGGHVSIHAFDNLKSEVSIYPMPFEDELHISIDGSAIKLITILDLMGRKISSYAFEQGSDKIVLNTSQLNKGAYLLNIVFNNGFSQTKSVVKN